MQSAKSLQALVPVLRGMMACALGLGMAGAAWAQTASLSPDSVNLSGADFFAAYTDSDAARRERAQLYLLGVMDATEGRDWCAYQLAKSITLREIVFEHLRKQSSAHLQKRASVLITEALRTSLACKEKR